MSNGLQIKLKMALRLDSQCVSMSKYAQSVTSATTKKVFTVVFYKLHPAHLDPMII
jgi:hypothetical protein